MLTHHATRPLFAWTARTAALALAGVLAGACAASEEPPTGTLPGESPLQDQLQRPTSFSVETGGSTATVVAQAQDAEGPTEVEIPILGGSTVAWVTGADELVVEEFSVDLDDVTIPAELVPPDGLPLRDIHVSIERPRGAVLDDLGDMIATVVELDVRVEWSAEFGADGKSYPLRTMHLDDLPVAVEIQEGPEGQLRAHVSAVRQGEFWQWADTFELRDLYVDLELSTAPAPE